MSTTNTDLQALFANLRPRSQQETNTSSPGTPAAPAAFGLPPSTSPPPPFSGNAAAAGSNTTGNMVSHNPSNSATAQSLLNLLNFGSNAGAQSATEQAAPAERSAGHEPTRNVWASDLVSLLSPGAGESYPKPTNNGKMEDQGGGGPSKTQEETSQDALLKLLSKAHSKQSSRAASADMQRTASNQSKVATPAKQSIIPEEAPEQSAKPLFTYQNPFEQLNASRQGTPQITERISTRSPIFKNVAEIPQPSIETPDVHRTGSPGHPGRTKLTPRSVSARAERLARESSVKSAGTPEPVIKEESSSINMNDLPIRTAETVPLLSSVQPEPTGQPGVADANNNASPAIGADEWEDAEESPATEEERKVIVYNFPIKPFVSITLQLAASSKVQIREEGVMEISRLKKDFDQLDRSLAAATTKYIAYALVKNGGIRIIRQDDGVDRQVFKHTHDRIFNVAFCTTATNTPASDHQAVLGTGVSGTVYYATISKEGNDLFENNELETESLAFPPWPAADDNTAGGALKTRAKRSSRHPEYFAIGRGKSIHLIWPANSMFSRYGVSDTNRHIDMEKLYGDRNLQIATGKAGKDFAFSEDDTLIVSLDKTGRLRFWDIRELTDETNATASRVTPVKVDVPLLSLSTASPAEKSWPTSVLFVDKQRPYLKGGALRYVLVGLRQNHTLQLWDVALGKAVQELNFPHENETDGVCSVNYHPSSGIIVVGHPTRNSLFFIHLSAPRYTLSSSITQAAFIQRVAAKDPNVPRPDSTACMSGVREISFASKGQLRSVEMLPIHKDKTSSSSKVTDDKTGLFELYVVHSKGVTCLTITKQDLGWDANSKVIHGVDAEKEGVVGLKELKLGGVIEEVRNKSPPEEVILTPSTSASKSKRKKKSQQTTESTEEATSDPVLVAAAAAASQASGLSNGFATQPDVPDSDAVKEPKKTSKKKATQASEVPPSAKTLSRTSSPAKIDVAASASTTQPEPTQPTSSTDLNPSTDHTTDDMGDLVKYEKGQKEKVTVGVSGDWLDKETKKIIDAICKELKIESESLYRKINNDRIVGEANLAARHESILRLVSTTLTSNVDKSLRGIVGQGLRNEVLPQISNVTAQTISMTHGEAVAKTLHNIVPTMISTHLPSALTAAINNPHLLRAINDNICNQVGQIVENMILDLNAKTIIPTVKTSIHDVLMELQDLKEERKRDMARMEKFGQVIQGLSATIQTMSENQVAFQKQIMAEREQFAAAAPATSSSTGMSPFPAPIARPAKGKGKTKDENDQEEIQNYMTEGNYEDAATKFLQLGPEQQSAVFDAVFDKFTPDFLADVSTLVAFSIAVAVSNDLNTNIKARLDWIFHALGSVDPYVSTILLYC
jgi:hypothetical protein